MKKTVFTAIGLLIVSALILDTAFPEDKTNENIAKTSQETPEGMEIRQVNDNPGYKLLLPKGTAIRKEGDLRVIEGAGEYAARKSAEFDERLNKMSADIETLRQEINQIKKAIEQNR